MSIILLLYCIVGFSTSSVYGEYMFNRPMLIELARFIPDVKLPTWFTYGAGGRLDPGMRMGPIDPMDIILFNGYPGERHKVETEDGYILELHRLPRNSSSTNFLPVLLVHGILQSSADWLINNPVNSSFAFMLWDHGFDVWLGNHRGGHFSKGHKRYSTASKEYWDYSMDEMGAYDVPAMIDYVLGLSIKPEYNTKIGSGTNMGAGIFFSNMWNGMLHWISYPGRLVELLINLFGTFPIIPSLLSQTVNSMAPAICKMDVVGGCPNVINLILGNDGGQIKPDQLPLIMSILGSSTSLNKAYHIFQMARHHQFAHYDYGGRRNLKIYGQRFPPIYNLSKVTAPMTIYTAKHDLWGNRKDASFFVKKLPHGGELAAELVYTRIIKKLKAG